MNQKCVGCKHYTAGQDKGKTVLCRFHAPPRRVVPEWKDPATGCPLNARPAGLSSDDAIAATGFDPRRDREPPCCH